MLARLMGLETIDPTTLHRRIERGEPLAILDVNSSASWRSARIPGARHLDPASFGEHDLPGERERALVFYCANPFCRKAPLAARRVLRLGYQNVQVLSAGISGWLAAGLPAESGA